MRRFPLVAGLFLSLAASAEQFDHDDATARALARSTMYGEPTAEQQLRAIQAAQAEAGAAPTSDAWVNVGPSDGVQISPVVGGVDSGRIRRIVPHPTDPNILYVATAGGGVWKTFTAQAAITATTGPRWMNITDNIGSQSVGAFALDPNSPDTLYLGLGDPFDVHTPGFFTSLDGGVTWSSMITLTGAAGPVTSVRDIVVDPANTGVVLVATDAGVFKSSEGSPFTYLDQFNGNGDCWSIASVGPSVWLVSCRGHVFRSTDNALTFGEITAGLTADAGDLGRMTLAAAPGDRLDPSHARVYLLAGNLYGSDQKDVFYSNSGGSQWFSLDMVPESVCGVTCNTFTNAGSQPDLDLLHDQAWYNQAILVDPDDHDTVFLGGNLNLARSKDGGLTWALMGDWLPNGTQGTAYLSYVHADHHAMAVQKAGPSSPKYFYSGNDGGVFRSSDIFTGAAPSNVNPKTVTFEDKINRGIVSHLVYSVASDIHDAANTKMIGGLQDNGTRMRIISGDGSGTLFDEMIGADGFGVGIGRYPATTGAVGSLLIGTVYGTIWRSVDSGSNFAVTMNGICQARAITEAFGSACDVDQGTNFYMKMASDQAAPTGQVFVTVINNSTCSPTATTCTVPGNNTVYSSSNGGHDWVNSNGSIGASFPDSLRFVGTNPLHAGHWTVVDYAHVYVTTDSGANWTQSASLSDGVNAAAFEGSSGGIVWAVAGNRVYRSTGIASGWTDMTHNLGSVALNTVAVNPANASQIFLGTQIGLYRSDDGGGSWKRAGVGSLPLVSVTEISITLDGQAVRVSTYGRGFWELYGSASAPTGVLGNGDFDHNQVLDGFDVVAAAAAFGTTPADPDYNWIGNLTGSNNAIDASDINVLVARLGGRP